MAEVAWSGPAKEDLHHIYEFISRDAKQYAATMVRRIQEAVARLGEFPESGRVVPEFPSGGYREVLVGPYRVIYSFLENRSLVVLLAVVHGSRLIPPIFEDR